jgi:hypothetical protein
MLYYYVVVGDEPLPEEEMMKFRFTAREYQNGEFKNAVTTGHDQILEADSLEEARADYIHWLEANGYFEDKNIPEDRREEAVLGYEIEEGA